MSFKIGNKFWKNKKTFKHSQESIEKIKIARKRQVITPEHRMAIGKALKGRMPSNIGSIAGWNKGMSNSWSKGVSRPIIVRRKIGDAQIGVRNHNWKGGRTPLRIKIYGSIEWQNWRKAIFERDNYTCMICQSRAVRLEADHHLIKFSELLSQFNIKSLREAKECGNLWDINLGRTLCRPCHLKTPNYGNRK